MATSHKQGDFKFVAVRKWIMESIENNVFKYGTKLPSENFICKKFSISRQTVRNAIDGLEKDGIVTRRHGSGTYVAKMLGDVRNRAIGVLTTFFHDYIFPSMLQGIEETFTAENYGISFGITYNKLEAERRFLERMLESNVSGLLLEGTKTSLPNPNIGLYQEIIRRDIPIVFMNNYYRELVDICPCVLLDDTGCVKRLTQHLIENGHRKIAGVFKFDDIQGVRRYSGYLAALMEAGIPVDEDIIHWVAAYTDGGLARSIGYPLLDSIKGCSAVVCYNDELAGILYHYLYEQGMRVPKDISMVGFDDSFSSPHGGLELATVRHPKKALGAKAAGVLMDMVKNGKDAVPPGEQLMKSDVLLRGSVRSIVAESRPGKDAGKEGLL